MNWRKHIILPLLCVKNGSKQLQYERSLEKSQWLSYEEIEREKDRKLQALLHHANVSVPYYKSLFAEGNIDPLKITSCNDLVKLPILTKRVIQEKKEELLSTNRVHHPLLKEVTGGSTGSPLEIYYDSNKHDWRKAAEWRHNRWAGYDLGMKCAALWGAVADKPGVKGFRSRVYKYMTSNNLFLNAYAITDTTLHSFTTQLKTYRPQIILAYARMIALYGRYLLERGESIPRPLAIISTAELLTAEDREIVEKVFQCPVFDRYGSRELSIIASECPQHTMHCNDENVHVEFINAQGKPCAYGEEGEMFITDLTNYGMPLIRYKIGDTGMPLKNECNCGRGLSVMKIKSGRVTDFIITPQGKKVSGAAIASGVICNIDGIGQIQFYQKRSGDLLIKIVKNNKFNERTIPELKKRIDTFLDAMPADIECVDSIPVPVSGKMMFCINEMLSENGRR